MTSGAPPRFHVAALSNASHNWSNLTLLYGAWEENRTPDLRITSALLYRLSYPGASETRYPKRPDPLGRPGSVGRPLGRWAPSVHHARQLDHQGVHEQRLVGVADRGPPRPGRWPPPVAPPVGPRPRSRPSGTPRSAPIGQPPAGRGTPRPAWPARTGDRRSATAAPPACGPPPPADARGRPWPPSPRPGRPGPRARATCRCRNGARASSAAASSSVDTAAAAAPVPSSRDGTDRHRSWRATNPASLTSSRARSRLPPEARATASACSGSTPRSTSQRHHRPGGHGIERDLHAAAHDGGQGRREVVGQQDEDRGRRRLLHRLQQGGHRPRGPGGRRSPPAPGGTPPGVAAGPG